MQLQIVLCRFVVTTASLLLYPELNWFLWTESHLRDVFYVTVSCPCHFSTVHAFELQFYAFYDFMGILRGVSFFRSCL